MSSLSKNLKRLKDKRNIHELYIILKIHEIYIIYTLYQISFILVRACLHVGGHPLGRVARLGGVKKKAFTCNRITPGSRAT